MTTDNLAVCPFPAGPRGGPPTELDQRLQDDPLGLVRMPSGDVARLAVRYSDVMQVLSDSRFARELDDSTGPRFLPGFDFMASNSGLLINMDGQRHQRLRSFTTKAFSRGQVERQRPRIYQIADDLITDFVSQGPPFDFVDQFANVLSSAVMAELLGIPLGSCAELRDGFGALCSVATGAAAIELAKEKSATYAERVNEIVRTVEKAPGDGLISELINLRDERAELSDSEVCDLVLMMIIAGHTPTNILTRAAITVLSDPDLYRFFGGTGDLSSAVDELLRCHSPALSSMRVATEDVDLPSGTIRKGEAVLASIEAANHDPRVFSAPRSCRPSRYADSSTERHLAFGRGPHFCSGAHLSHLEIEATFSCLARRLPTLRLDIDPDDIEWGAFMRSPLKLPMSW
ncbi:cytochrome P450 [Streptomyces sp. NPDC127084]|uniref:cytochrome P450 n=1 Tax=Streptomyces sp. NPDC127084 TaxID=3347133 RepID=UPI003652C33F